ncbi:phosphotransferase family protein [Paenibacillus kobensis]|uniref:phosphotransferase family protein n=1 Tax=Paenibacillus kobensis TaxID=59841 RepID=UPI000FD9883F|nr:aminoglycoside phosphotransferase family protein [Paenibacillus kobensis]
MESTTKKKLSDAVIRQLAAKAFGSDISVIGCTELSDGWFNTAYSIDLSDGRGTVLKVSPPEDVRTLRYERNLMEAEVQTMRLIAEAGGVPIPKLQGYDSSRELIDCEYFFQERITGRTLNHIKEQLSDQEKAAIDRELGIFNSKINQITGESYGYVALPSSRRGSWKDSFGLMIEWLLQDGLDASVELPIPYEQFNDLMSPHLPALDAVQAPKLVFWDLWDGNVFVNEGRVSGIIDTERAFWGDPLMEHYFSHFACSEAFLAGYGVERPSLNPQTNSRRLLYDLHLALVMRIESTYRDYNEDHTNWTTNILIERIEALRTAQ